MNKPNISWTKVGLPRRSFLKGATALGGLAAAGMMWPRAAYAAGGTLKTRTYADIRSMDPAFSQGVVDEEIHAAIYNKLIQYKPGREWGWQLDAAAMIEQVDDTHINFALKDNIGFTGGFGAMTAEDVKFSFERIIDDSLESTNKPDWGPLDHVEVTGERPGTIVLKNAFQPLWSITLPYIAGNIVSKAAFESVGGKIDTQPVATSGPTCMQAGSRSKKPRCVAIPTGRATRPRSTRSRSITSTMKRLPRSPSRPARSTLRASVSTASSVSSRTRSRGQRWRSSRRSTMFGWA
jgi:peptide/nickel transport system substrate-binding protein